MPAPQGLSGKLLFTELFPSGRQSFGTPTETHAQVHRAPDQSPRDCSATAPRVSLVPEGKSLSFPEGKLPAAAPKQHLLQQETLNKATAH